MWPKLSQYTNKNGTNTENTLIKLSYLYSMRHNLHCTLNPTNFKQRTSSINLKLLRPFLLKLLSGASKKTKPNFGAGVYKRSFKLINPPSPFTKPSNLNQQKFAMQYHAERDTLNCKRHNLKILTSFKLYMQVNYTTNFSAIRTHASAAKHFFFFAKQGLMISNIHKIFQKWKNIYYLLFNLHFYKVHILTFGTTFFKNEVQSLNWLTSSKIKFIWRYAHVFIFFSPNKLTNIGNLVFNHLKLAGYNSAVILDATYHKYTLNYLTKLHYYTIGLIPSTTNYKLVDFAIPIASDSIFAQLFFIRLKLNIKRQSLSFFYKNQELPLLKNL